jgi:predicted ABC-type ATPase
VARVANRVGQGGQSVPEEDVRRRYNAGLRNLFQLYLPLADAWWIFDGSKLPPKIIVKENRGKLSIPQLRLYRQIKKAAEGETHE